MAYVDGPCTTLAASQQTERRAYRHDPIVLSMLTTCLFAARRVLCFVHSTHFYYLDVDAKYILLELLPAIRLPLLLSTRTHPHPDHYGTETGAPKSAVVALASLPAASVLSLGLIRLRAQNRDTAVERVGSRTYVSRRRPLNARPLSANGRRSCNGRWSNTSGERCHRPRPVSRRRGPRQQYASRSTSTRARCSILRGGRERGKTLVSDISCGHAVDRGGAWVRREL
jgi:hypothetical protein